MQRMPVNRPVGQPQPATSEMKKSLLIMVGGVVVLDAIAIAIYQFAHITERPVKTQETFVAVWVVATLIVVTTMMRKIRQARRRR
jgi:flagellar basal body-associated protein FliL